MSTKRRTLKLLHRVHALLTVIVLIASITLYWTGVLTGFAATLMFVAVELPLLIVFVIISAVRFRGARSRERKNTGFLDRLVEEEPLLAGPAVEIRAAASLGRWVARRPNVPAGAAAYGYANGSAMIPIVMIVASVIELAVVHVLVPWQWLRILLLVLTIWAIVFVLGYLSMRATHPHLVDNENLTLRWGREVVVRIPLTEIVDAQFHTGYRYTHPEINGETLVLPASQGTNVRLEFAEPVSATPPISRRHRPSDYRASEVLLGVDEPESFITELRVRSESIRQ